MSEEFPIEEVFDSAVSIVRNLPKEGPIKPSDDLKLRLYAFYKQATHGPNDTPKPRFYQIVDGYKWEAWTKLGEMSKEDAMSNYIAELRQIMESIPHEEADSQDKTHFEDVLGKKFYDYWFGQWEQSRMQIEVKAPELSFSRDSCATDQFSQVVLRLQQGLQETDNRLSTVEGQLKRAIDRISALQTSINQPAKDLFYLAYPIIIYFIIRAFERKPATSGRT